MLLGWWPIWGNPTSAIVGMQNMLAQSPKALVMVIGVTRGNWLGKHHGWFLDGIRFPTPLTMISLVFFLN